MAELMQQSGSQLGLRVYHLRCELHTGQVPMQQRGAIAQLFKRNLTTQWLCEADLKLTCTYNGLCTSGHQSLNLLL